MSETRKWSLVVGGMAMAIAAWVAKAADPTQQQLMDKINALQAEVDQLKTGQAQQSVQEQEMIEHVLADADKHSQMLDANGGFNAGWNPDRKQFFLGSQDGNFYFHPGIIFQA